MTSLRFSSLLASLVLIACTSIACVAQASTADSTRADFAARTEDNARLCGATRELLQYQQCSDAPLVGKLKASESKDPKDSAASQAPGAGRLVLRSTQACPLPCEILRFTSVTHAAQYLVSSALPRGPPYVSV